MTKHNFKFGDTIENHYASEDNPHRIGIFVKRTTNGDYEMTDGKGSFWRIARDNEKLVRITSQQLANMVDKYELSKYLNALYRLNSLSQAGKAIDHILNEIESGRFDVKEDTNG